MTYEEWIEHCKKVINQYEEGAILASEAFNSIVGHAYEVEQFKQCPMCGVKIDTDKKQCGNHKEY